jgi:hypothetical protein
MSRVLRYLVPGLLFIVVGFVLSATGGLERRVVDTRKHLLTLNYAAPADEHEDVERTIRYAQAAPWIAPMRAEVREQEATSRYWQSEYGALALPVNESGETGETDAEILFLAANAAYRTMPAGASGAQGIQQLERILGQYVEVLKQDPTHFDAAYNYEYVARVRDGLARARGGRPDPKVANALKPAARTIHGMTGRIPPGQDMSDFKVIVPQRSDERKEQPEAGKGGPPVRKG